MEKSTDGDSAFCNTSRFGAKRSHQWFVNTDAPELFPNKKQVVCNLDSKTDLGISHASAPSWVNTSGYRSVSNPFINRLFGSETRPSNFEGRNTIPVQMENLGGSIDQSLPHDLEAPNGFLAYSGLKKVKVNQVKENDNGIHFLRGQNFSSQSSIDMSAGQAFDTESESGFIPIGQSYNREVETVTMTGHNYNGDMHTGPSANYIKADQNVNISGSHTQVDPQTMSFVGFHEAHDIMPVGRPIDSYDESYNQSPGQIQGEICETELGGASTMNAVVRNTAAIKSKPSSASKTKQESKTTKKEAPNSFPSNVRSLISTGMLDGVPVKYVSVSRQELRSIIKGSGYLCGCQSCNYLKVLNAYEFERHAGCKTKHPNNHIYFENGKTIYQIVQELRSTPVSMLFDVIQTVFGAPINQKAFLSWKESFQAATRELQRIYGKEELNL